jgi:hypothetical protein
MRLFILKESLRDNTPALVRFENDREVKRYPDFFIEVSVESPEDIRSLREIEWERFTKDSIVVSPSG